jgi:hypothetical protein
MLRWLRNYDRLLPMGSRGRPVDLEDEVGLPKKALIFGTTGEDGSFLSEFLLPRQYQVRCGASGLRPSSSHGTSAAGRSL